MRHGPPVTRRLTTALLPAVLLLAGAGAAQAGPYTGVQEGVLTGYNPFSISGNSVTVTSNTALATFLTIPDAGVTNGRLLGLNSIWVVDNSGNSIAGVAAVSSNVTGTNPATTWATDSNPAGFIGSNGFGSNDPFIQLVNDATLASGSGKGPSGYNGGVFTFSGLAGKTGTSLAIDYLISNGANGVTGRTIFVSIPREVDASPEPGAIAFGLTSAIGTLGLMARARTRRRRAA